jgi:hypothetical protein
MSDAVVRLLAPDYLTGLAARPLDELRGMRAECQEVETGLSLVRRLVQGHLDIVTIEMARRADGGAPGDLSDLLELLPEVLADRTQSPGHGRLPVQMAPVALDPSLEAELSALLGPGMVLDPSSIDDDRLAGLVGSLEALEGDVSARRRAVFERLDAVQEELARRYRSGDASVDSLLH